MWFRPLDDLTARYPLLGVALGVCFMTTAFGIIGLLDGLVPGLTNSPPPEEGGLSFEFGLVVGLVGAPFELFWWREGGYHRRQYERRYGEPAPQARWLRPRPAQDVDQ